jgi:hypothetical protein
MHDNNIEIIQPLIQEFQHFFVFSVLAPWWPSKESEQIEFRSGRSHDLGVHMYDVQRFRSIRTPGSYKM